MTLTDFILARLAEDEAVAQDATPGPWSAADEHGLLDGAEPAWCVSQMRPGYESMSPRDGYIGDVAETSLGFRGQSDEANAAHIARHDPARVLADIEAKRRIVERLEQAERLVRANNEAHNEASRRGAADQMNALRIHGWELAGRRDGLLLATTALALPFADHPDYQEAWRP